MAVPRSAFAFVKYTTEDAATKCIAAEDGARWYGRNIRVQFREPRKPQQPQPFYYPMYYPFYHMDKMDKVPMMPIWPYPVMHQQMRPNQQQSAQINEKMASLCINMSRSDSGYAQSNK